MGQITGQGITIDYPDQGWVFNPITVKARGTIGARVRMQISGLVIDRTIFTVGGTEFNVAGMAQTLFTAEDIHTITSPDSSQKKTFTCQALKFDAATGWTLIGTFSIPVIWGALQPGESWSQIKDVLYFPGYPFTLPITVNEITYLWARQDRSTYTTSPQTLNPGKYNRSMLYANATERVVIRLANSQDFDTAIFDRTFDHTFRGIGAEANVQYITLHVGCIPENGVYLRWLSTFGEWHYMMFRRITETVESDDLDLNFQQYYTDMGYTNGYNSGTGGSVGKSAQRTLSLAAPLLPKWAWSYTKGITEAPFVDMFMGGSNWLRCHVSTSEIVEDNTHMQDLSITLVLPKRQVQTL